MSKHLKRLASPRSWQIPRKTDIWVVKPAPGPHPIDHGISLLLGVRNFLKLGNIASESKRIIGNGEIYVDGKVTRQYKRPLGLMDVISVPKLNLNYRILLDIRGKLRFIKISKDEAKWKLVRIENKNTISGGITQLNLHDGRNILLKKDKYKTGDVLKISVPGQKVLANFPFEAGNLAMLIGGNHVGEFATISRFEEIKNPKPNIVYFDGFSTIKNYVFIVGHEKPEITAPDVSVFEEPKKEPNANKDTEEPSSE